jgi:hypothetical protein
LDSSDTTKRKSLAVDQKTYDMLQEVCLHHRRSKIEQLKILIEHEMDAIRSGYAVRQNR